MHIPKANTKQIYAYLMAEGVMVCEKDTRAPTHPDLPIPNLQVMMTLRSLKSRGYLTEQFSWHHHYYFLTDEGILFLRQYLNLPDSVVPATLTKGAHSGRRVPEGEERRGGPKEGGERRGSAWRGKLEQPVRA